MNAVATPYPGAIRLDVSQPWRHALAALAVLWLGTLLIYRETGTAMVTIWARSDTFAHAFLVPPIVLWLIWRQRRLLREQVPCSLPGWLVLVAGAALFWLLGELAAVHAVTQLALVALLVLTVPVVLGWSLARLIIFPLGFLFFAVPVGEFLMPGLMEWTANFTVLALRLSGIPVYREGLQFVIPSGSWSVVEACSGVRYLIASLTVGSLFAYLNYQSTKRRILFVMVSILVPVVANWMRAYMIVMLGHLSDNRLAAGVDHLIYGWLFFGIVIMLMFIIGARWSESPQKESPFVSGPSFVSHAITVSRVWAATAAFGGLMALPHVALWALESGPERDAAQLNAPTVLSPGWQLMDKAAADFSPAFQNPSAGMNASYTSEGRAVGLYLGYYHHQSYGRKMVSSTNVLVRSNDPQWAQVASASRAIVLKDQQAHAMRTAELRGTTLNQSGQERRLVVWQIFWVNGTLTSSDYLAKAYGAFHRLTGRSDDSAVIVVYTPKDQEGGTEQVLESFLTTNYASINALLRKARQRSDRQEGQGFLKFVIGKEIF